MGFHDGRRSTRRIKAAPTAMQGMMAVVTQGKREAKREDRWRLPLGQELAVASRLHRGGAVASRLHEAKGPLMMM
jgi:hypothetical protein